MSLFRGVQLSSSNCRAGPVLPGPLRGETVSSRALEEEGAWEGLGNPGRIQGPRVGLGDLGRTQALEQDMGRRGSSQGLRSGLRDLGTTQGLGAGPRPWQDMGTWAGLEPRAGLSRGPGSSQAHTNPSLPALSSQRARGRQGPSCCGRARWAR